MKQKIHHIKSRLLPCILLSLITGIVAGLLIFIFKLAASKIIHVSEHIYAIVRADLRLFPLWLLGAAILGLLSAIILKHARQCRGGGIPTAIMSIRGIAPLRWLQSLFALFVSSLITYLAGVPLGSEGPSVQMGTAAGKGCAETLTRKNLVWERYLMTGGACAGFATALGAPLTGILFAVEEIHRRFSPMIFTAAGVSVITATVIQEILAHLLRVDVTLFHFPKGYGLPLSMLWIPLLIGISCGLLAILFTKLYRSIRILNAGALKKIPTAVKISAIFVISALFGFFSGDFIGSGHALIEKILHDNAVWYLLLPALLVRALLMLSANSSGVTGGMFIPILTFGAIVAALISSALVAPGIIATESMPILIAIGMAAFLSAAYRTPITALAFALEVLCGADNLLPVGTAVLIAYLIIEIFHIPSFNDTVIEAKTEAMRDGAIALVVDTKLTVEPGAFAIGQEVQDILWPPTCTVLRIDKATNLSRTDHTIAEGDVVHLHYQTLDPNHTLACLEQILGQQTKQTKFRSHIEKKNEEIPNQ